jgi:hypothetical protein
MTQRFNLIWQDFRSPTNSLTLYFLKKYGTIESLVGLSYQVVTKSLP